MINLIKKLIISKKSIAIIIILLVLVVVVVKFSAKKDPNRKNVSWYTLQKHPAVLSIHKYGKMSTGNNVSITAPFDGKIIALYYALGNKVVKGQKLITLSTESIIKKQHEAKSDYLKKLEDYNKYCDWENSSDVQKAKQSLIDARQQLKIAREKLQDDHFLYKQGIISRDEMDQQKQTVEQSRQQIESAQLSLKDILKQGDSDNLLIAKLAMLDSKNTWEDIEKKIKHATLLSPATGVALKPKQTGTRDTSSFEAVVGEAVTENQNLLTIGSSDNLIVTGSLSQEEINEIRTGTPVTITSDAFPGITLKGTINSISKLADESQSSSPSFPFTVSLNTLPEKYKKLMRFGLMVDIALETYHNRNALTVPIAAVYHEDAKSFVWLKKDKNTAIKRYVTPGPTLPYEIVITDGLKEGDQVRVVNE